MFWCAGNWGTLYPFTGNTSHSGQDYAENHLIVAKFVALMQRRGSIMFTIGPSNVCNSSSSPVVIKDQYRFQQIAPVVRKGRAVVFGDPGYFQTPAVSNAPTREYTNNYIYQGRQCCDRNF
jgi:conjugal transfer pilus assembly protein TraU